MNLSYWNSGCCVGNPRRVKFLFNFAYFSSSSFSISDIGPDVFTWNVPSSACSRNGCSEKPTFLGCLADFGTCPAWIRRDSTGIYYIYVYPYGDLNADKEKVHYFQYSLCFIVFHTCFLCGFVAGLVEDQSSLKICVSYTIFMWWLYAIEQLCWHNCTYYILCTATVQLTVA